MDSQESRGHLPADSLTIRYRTRYFGDMIAATSLIASIAVAADHSPTKKTNISSMATFFYDGGPLMKRFLPVVFLLGSASAVAQLHQYKATEIPRAGENIAQPCDYQASFPAGHRAVKAAWVTYDRGPDITRYYSDPDVLAFAKRNDVAMVLAIQCPASEPETGEKGEMDMNPKHGLGRSLFSALNTLGTESGHPELRDAKLILLGFSGTGAYFGHFVA